MKIPGVKRDRPKGPQKRKLPSRPNSMLISSSGDQGGGGEEEEEQPSIDLGHQPASKTQSPPPKEDEQEVPRTGLKLRRVTDLPGMYYGF